MKRLLDDLLKFDKELDQEMESTPEFTVWKRDGTLFDPNTPLIKARYRFKGDTDPEYCMSLLYERRMEWDKNLLFNDLLVHTPGLSVVHYAINPPLPFMQPKDFIEKRISFVEDGAHYAYYSCVPDSVFPPKDDHERCHLIFGGTVLRKEGEDYAYYSLTQTDMNVPTFRGLRAFRS